MATILDSAAVDKQCCLSIEVSGYLPAGTCHLQLIYFSDFCLHGRWPAKVTLHPLYQLWLPGDGVTYPIGPFSMNKLHVKLASDLLPLSGGSLPAEGMGNLLILAVTLLWPAWCCLSWVGESSKSGLRQHLRLILTSRSNSVFISNEDGILSTLRHFFFLILFRTWSGERGPFGGLRTEPNRTNKWLTIFIYYIILYYHNLMIYFYSTGIHKLFTIKNK